MHFNNTRNTPRMPDTERVVSEEPDTIIISAREDSFCSVFLKEWCWYPIRIGAEKLTSLKWIAVYRTAPISAITHFAKIEQIDGYKGTGRYKIVFKEPEKLGTPVARGDGLTRPLQGQRYTTLERITKAKLIEELKPWL